MVLKAGHSEKLQFFVGIACLNMQGKLFRPVPEGDLFSFHCFIFLFSLFLFSLRFEKECPHHSRLLLLYNFCMQNVLGISGIGIFCKLLFVTLKLTTVPTFRLLFVGLPFWTELCTEHLIPVKFEKRIIACQLPFLVC